MLIFLFLPVADDLFFSFSFVCWIKLSMYDKTRNRGLAFVTMGSHEEALAAITNLESYVSILKLKKFQKI